MKSIFLNEFDIMEAKFLKLTQETKSVAKYEERFRPFLDLLLLGSLMRVVSVGNSSRVTYKHQRAVDHP